MNIERQSTVAQIMERLGRGSAIAEEIGRCESDLDQLFFDQPAVSIAPAPIHFFNMNKIAQSVPIPINETANQLSTMSSEGVGGQIRILRLSRGLTQKQLAEITGIRRPNIARLEKGATMPNLSTLLKLARALSSPVSSFFK